MLWRGFIGIELCKEGGEDFAILQAHIRLREEGAVAVIAVIADEEYLYADLACFAGQCNHIGIADIIHIDILFCHDGGQHFDAVTYMGCFFEILGRTGFLHLLLQSLQQCIILAEQEFPCFLHLARIILNAYLANAGRGAAFDVILQAGTFACRKFNIKGTELAKGDDYGMMREMLKRRFTRLNTEMDDGTTPDLVLIDGGMEQLNAALETLAELGLSDIPVVGIAKGPDRNAGRERFFMKDRADFQLEMRDPVLYFLQRLRDESHRFVIGSHRARRVKAISNSPLDGIAGIGPTRKKKLLLHFGSAQGVSKAGISDLQRVPGINAELAKQIYDYFHSG